jgi:hypothetical protein
MSSGAEENHESLNQDSSAPKYGCRAVRRIVSADLLQMPFADRSVRVRARKLAAEPCPLGHLITP